MRKQSIKMDRQKSNETHVNHLIDIVPGKNQPLSTDHSHDQDKKQPFAKRLGHRIGKIFGKHWESVYLSNCLFNCLSLFVLSFLPIVFFDDILSLIRIEKQMAKMTVSALTVLLITRRAFFCHIFGRRAF